MGKDVEQIVERKTYYVYRNQANDFKSSIITPLVSGLESIKEELNKVTEKTVDQKGALISNINTSNMEIITAINNLIIKANNTGTKIKTKAEELDINVENELNKKEETKE